MTKKYPIGTRIKYVSSKGEWGDFYGKEGTVVNIVEGLPVISLSDSLWAWMSFFSNGGRPTFLCDWCDIKLFIQKEEQLLFDFVK